MNENPKVTLGFEEAREMINLLEGVRVSLARIGTYSLDQPGTPVHLLEAAFENGFWHRLTRAWSILVAAQERAFCGATGREMSEGVMSDEEIETLLEGVYFWTFAAASQGEMPHYSVVEPASELTDGSFPRFDVDLSPDEAMTASRILALLASTLDAVEEQSPKSDYPGNLDWEYLIKGPGRYGVMRSHTLLLNGINRSLGGCEPASRFVN